MEPVPDHLKKFQPDADKIVSLLKGKTYNNARLILEAVEYLLPLLSKVEGQACLDADKVDAA